MQAKNGIFCIMEAQRAYENVFIARQPIFSATLAVWGYQLLYRDSDSSESARFTDALEATLKVMTNISLCGEGQHEVGNVVVTFPEESILINAPFALPPSTTVVLVNEDLESPRYVLDSLRALKREGYRIMLGNFTADPGKQSLYRMADVLAFDISGLLPEELGQLVAEAEAYEVPLLARRIEQHEEYELARYLGCNLFQGFFFKRPNILSTRRPTASEAAKLRLFQAIKTDTMNLDALTEAIEADVSVSYRLLALLNSPAFGFRSKVSSIRQAIVLLGWKQLKHWLRLVILTDVMAPDKAFELAFLAAQRARFLELCAEKSSQSVAPDTLFLLGLLSLLEAMMDMPMRELVTNVFLEEELKNALCGEDNLYSPWLELAVCVESADWSRLEALLPRVGLNLSQIDESYHAAIAWANDFFCAMQ